MLLKTIIVLNKYGKDQIICPYSRQSLFYLLRGLKSNFQFAPVIPEIPVMSQKVLPIFYKHGCKEGNTFMGAEREDVTDL